MSTTATTEAMTVGWRLWVPGAAAPVACFAADYLIGEPVRSLAPAGLPSLAVIGIACLAISHRRSQSLAGLATAGPMWLVGVVALLVGIPLLVISIPVAIVFPLALLGCVPFWTGITYLREAHALTKAQSALRGRLRTGLLTFLGALAALVAIVAAEIANFALIDMRLAAIDRQAPRTWEPAFQSLGSYPLCGRRCREQTCTHLFRQFGETQSGDLNAPRELDDAFKRSFGSYATSYCLSPA